jgi:hypothetical protein
MYGYILAAGRHLQLVTGLTNNHFFLRMRALKLSRNNRIDADLWPSKSNFRPVTPTHFPATPEPHHWQTESPQSKATQPRTLRTRLHQPADAKGEKAG